MFDFFCWTSDEIYLCYYLHQDISWLFSVWLYGSLFFHSALDESLVCFPPIIIMVLVAYCTYFSFMHVCWHISRCRTMGYMYSVVADAGQLLAKAVEPSSIWESHDASGLLAFFWGPANRKCRCVEPGRQMLKPRESHLCGLRYSAQHSYGIIVSGS